MTVPRHALVLRAFACSFLVGAALAIAPAAGCGGQTTRATGDGGTDAAADTSIPVDAAACVEVSVSSFDTSCTTAGDCITITAGQACPMSCMCGGSTINVSGQATYDKLVAGLGNGGCPCPADLPPSCVGGQCTICTGQPTDPAGCNGDAGQCVTVNPASYDESCQSDSDCVAAQVGTICPGSCECGNASVSQAAAAAIQQATQGIATLGCPCPPPDFASKCVGGTCTACTLGGGAAGCPDGG